MIKNSVITTGLLISLSMLSPQSWAAGYGSTLCKSPNYHCVKVTAGQSWDSLFPDLEKRTVVKKVNRMNTSLRAGMVIAVPNNIDSVGLMELAPFSNKIDAPQTNLVQISLSKLAWGAYDANGNLVNWGPVSGGKNYCADVRRGCKTPTGSYVVYSEKGANCKSSRFPLETNGGAPMPYCMHFKGGYAMHGSPTVPGFHASHGCVRMFTEDAKWLNINFVESGSTRVRILP